MYWFCLRARDDSEAWNWRVSILQAMDDFACVAVTNLKCCGKNILLLQAFIICSYRSLLLLFSSNQNSCPSGYSCHHIHISLVYIYKIDIDFLLLWVSWYKIALFTAEIYCLQLIFSHKFLQIHPDSSKRTGPCWGAFSIGCRCSYYRISINMSQIHNSVS